MFNRSANGNADAKRKISQNREGGVTILTKGCHFSGKLFCRGSCRIGGQVDGQIVSEGLLIIEEGAVIRAEVKADETIIQGFVEGKVEASTRVELCNTSVFDGDIASSNLIVHEGAKFNGRSQMLESKQNGQGVKQGDSIPDARPNKNIKLANAPDVAARVLPDFNLQF